MEAERARRARRASLYIAQADEDCAAGEIVWVATAVSPQPVAVLRATSARTGVGQSLSTSG